MQSYMNKVDDIVVFIRHFLLYRRHSVFIHKQRNDKETILQQAISEPVFYDDLVDKSTDCHMHDLL